MEEGLAFENVNRGMTPLDFLLHAFSNSHQMGRRRFSIL